MNNYTDADTPRTYTDSEAHAPGEAVSQPAHPPAQGRAGGGQLSHEQILDATAACLDEHGYDGTTIRRIASKLGCAVGSIYRYCSDKRTLLSQVAQRRYEPVLQAIEDHQPLERSVALYTEVAAQDAQQYRLMFWLASLSSGAHPSRPLPLVVARIIDGWSRQIGDPRQAQRIWAQIHGGLMLGLPNEALLRDVLGEVPNRRSEQAAPSEAKTEAPQQPSRSDRGIPVASRDRDDLNLL